MTELQERYDHLLAVMQRIAFNSRCPLAGCQKHEHYGCVMQYARQAAEEASSKTFSADAMLERYRASLAEAVEAHDNELDPRAQGMCAEWCWVWDARAALAEADGVQVT